MIDDPNIIDHYVAINPSDCRIYTPTNNAIDIRFVRSNEKKSSNDSD